MKDTNEIKILNRNRDINPLEVLILYALANNLPFSVTNIYNNGYIDYKNNLTLKGKEALKDITINSIIIDEPVTIEESMTFDEFVTQYRNKFKGKKVGAMGDKTALEKKLNRFIKSYNYSYDHMLNAIQLYINTCANDRYKYLQEAHYTVYKKTTKEETSRLASFCEELPENTIIKDINESNDSEFNDMI